MTTNGANIIQLHDCMLKEEECKARIAGMMAETALKWQEVQHKSLENLALYLDIKWDKQAHDNLIRQKMKAQGRVNKLREESEKMQRKMDWALKLVNAIKLSPEGVTAAWQGFYFISSKCSPKVIIAAYNNTKINKDAYEASSWAHSMCKDGAIVLPFGGKKTPADLFAWASVKNYFPVFMLPAWEYYTNLLTAIDDGAKEATAVIQERLLKAEKEADEISKIDWDRLKEPPPAPTP